jgi:imidazolonepropionase-like amidohydrolase
VNVRAWSSSGLLLIALSFAQHARAQDVALVGGDVYTVSGAMIPRATVVIRGERIVAVGKDIPVPASARKIDCSGKVITPGLIESESAIGLREIDLESSTVDSTPNWPDPVRAAVNALDAIDLRSPLVAVARRHGITSAIAAPNGGLISGRSAWVDLVGTRSKFFEKAARGPVAMHANLGMRGAQAVGGSRATAMMRFREVLDDARIFKKDRAAFQRNALYRLATSRLDLAALDPVLAGDMRLVLNVSRASDIVEAIAFAKRERLKIAIIGADEGWLVAKDLAQAKVPVIVEPLSNLPDSFEAKNARMDNATLLAQAGVKVALATRSSHNASNLRFALGNAVRAGLPQELALRAATLVPAEIYGLEKQYGSIEAGKIANIVVWTGDPFEPASYAETLIIHGEIQPPESRQTKLAERYIRRYQLAR